MPKYFAIPADIEKQIEDMVVVKTEQLEDQLEKNIAYEAVVNSLLYEVNDKIIDIEIQRDSKLRDLRVKYITGNSDEKDINDIRINRSEIDGIINGNRDIQVLNQKIQELQNMMKYYDRTLQTLRNKNYTLRNILEFRKWQSGVDK